VQVDARKVGAGSTLSADVCIIGAGAAGITVSRALAAKGHDVLLLESGGFKFDRATQSLYKGSSVGIPIDPTVKVGLDAPRLRFFGGTTNHWAGFCRPFPELDFAVRPWVPRSGWPIPRAALDPYYAGAQDVIKLGPYDYSVASWRDQGYLAQPFLDDDVTPHALFQVAGHPLLGDTYRDEIVASHRIKLVLWANVTHLALDESGNALDHVVVKTLSGNSFTARAPQYVLATGGLEVPRVLLSSNDRRPTGIGNETDQVGRSFMEHVNIAVGPAPLTVPESALAPYIPKPITVDVGGEQRDISLQTVALIAPDIIEREGLRSCEITLEYPFPPDDPGLLKVYPTVTRGIELLRAQGKKVGTVATARVLCEQEPNPASRVTITRAKDPLGMPRLQLDWRITRDDRLSILKTLRIFGSRLGALDVGRFRLDIAGYHHAVPAVGDKVNFEVNTGSHHMGTARMSTDPADGVVDADCKVHSVANLYIGGSAVYPTSGANPPTLTIVALALRLADHLDAIS
jgi:choline dehydrogenase-like flavoprotein